MPKNCLLMPITFDKYNAMKGISIANVNAMKELIKL